MRLGLAPYSRQRRLEEHGKEDGAVVLQASRQAAAPSVERMPEEIRARGRNRGHEVVSGLATASVGTADGTA
jgi:hypothetical protein